MTHFIEKNFTQAKQVLEDFVRDAENIRKVGMAVEFMVKSLQAGGPILSCGNGGSNSDSMHFCEELTGRFKKDRRPLGAISLSDPSHITCVSNDFGYEHIFSRGVEAYGNKHSTLLAISTSGNSKNVLLAIESAKKLDMKTVLLSGKTGGAAKDLCDVSIIVPSNDTERIQEIHIKIVHCFVEGIERKLFPELY